MVAFVSYFCVRLNIYMTPTIQSDGLQALISDGKFIEALRLAERLISDDPSDVVSYLAAAEYLRAATPMFISRSS